MNSENDVTDQWILDALALLPNPGNLEVSNEHVILKPIATPIFALESENIPIPTDRSDVLHVLRMKAKNPITGTVCYVWACRGVIYPDIR
mgnify:CR=1 FL=1